MATLGCVEFFIFLLHKYYTKLNIEQELVFADVHFTLFFTAIFNALESSLLAFCTTRVSERQWVKTEQLEVDHYVEIREEFERVEMLLYEQEGSDDLKQTITSRHSAVRMDDDNDASSSIGMDAAEIAFEFNCKGISRSCKDLARLIRHPHLSRKHHQLLVTIRFHELRIHFLQSNGLPLKFKVSDYLKRSELSVLIRLVHISTFAWLMLLGGVTLIYYFMGIVVFVTEDLSKVGISLTWIFMGSMIFSVVLSFLIYNKMKSIFSTIMRKRLKTETSTGRKDTSTSRNRGEEKITSQQALFWGGNPKFIRSIIQFMQFGFAIGLSILLVFWKDIDSKYAPVPAWGILICVLACDAAFLAIMAQVIPRYTLCTSLGQLVDEERLQETLAQWMLQEEQRKQRQNNLDPDYYEESWDLEEEDSSQDDDDASSRSSSIIMGPIVAAKKAISGGFQRMRKTDQRSKTFEDLDFTHGRAQSEHTEASSISEQSGDSVVHSAPLQDDPTTKSREQRSRDRKARRKAQSVGVAMMRNLGEKATAATTGDTTPTTTQADGKKRRPREHRRRSLSGSEDIQKMRRSNSFENQLLLAQLVQTDTKELRKKAGVDIKTGPTSLEQEFQARKNRKKSTSDGVALMRSVMEADRKELLSPPVSTADATAAATATPVGTQRRDRRRSISAAANIQQMRDMTLSGEETPSLLSLRRPPRSRQASGGVLRLEPLVEGVAADHSDSTLDIVPSTEVDESHVNGQVNGHQTESNARAESPATVGSDDKATKGTMDSASTIGDGHSDADDIPDVDQDAPRRRVEKHEPRPTLSESLRHYFLSQKYRMVSAVFGAVLCFFLVGMRVEILLIKSCVMPDHENTWHIELKDSTFWMDHTTFWMETAWLCCFITVGFYNAFVFRPGHAFSNKERSRFVSSLLDIVLSSTCLILLMVAESQRCCEDAEHRFLAGEPVVDAESELSCEEEYANNCCPSYGRRTHGGLGNIEPFTALVVLRILRFRIGKKIVAYMDKRLSLSELDAPEKSIDETIHPFHPFYSKRKQSRAEKQKTAETESAVELWMKAIADHSELVDEYGPFSSEILQVMLGFDVVCTSGVPRLIEPGASSENDRDDEQEHDAKTPEVAPRRKSEYVESRRAVERKYSHVSPEARSIILSGQLGNPPVSKSVANTGLASSYLPSALEPSMANKRQQDLIKSISPVLMLAKNKTDAPPKGVQFDLPPVAEVAFESKETVAAFAAPHARLLRSMRRCDRRLLPLLDKWTIVDVVITKWEIVYFDASDVDGTCGPEYTEEDIKHIESVRQAVIATKGGKGLRLKDVALGRKVVGHLELFAVDSVQVERIMPSESGDEVEDSSDGSKDVQVEFWKANSSSIGDVQTPRAARWSKVKQDRLRVHSEFGTLLLRFYSDLEDSESHPERCANELESDGPLFKDNAFQWCQTIARLCGVNQLKQKLEHFGDDNDDELRDYLVVVDSKTFQDHPRHMRKTSLGNILHNVKDHAQFWSMVNENAQTTGDDAPQGIPKPARGGRLSSFGAGPPKRRPSKMPLRRLSSTGDLPSSARDFNFESVQSEGEGQQASKSDHFAATGPDLV